MELLGGASPAIATPAPSGRACTTSIPRVPGEAEMVRLMRLAQTHLRPEQLWVNPTAASRRAGGKRVKPAIEAMVAAALPPARRRIGRGVGRVARWRR